MCLNVAQTKGAWMAEWLMRHRVRSAINHAREQGLLPKRERERIALTDDSGPAMRAEPAVKLSDGAKRRRNSECLRSFAWTLAWLAETAIVTGRPPTYDSLRADLLA